MNPKQFYFFTHIFFFAIIAVLAVLVWTMKSDIPVWGKILENLVSVFVEVAVIKKIMLGYKKRNDPLFFRDYDFGG